MKNDNPYEAAGAALVLVLDHLEILAVAASALGALTIGDREEARAYLAHLSADQLLVVKNAAMEMTIIADQLRGDQDG